MPLLASASAGTYALAGVSAVVGPTAGMASLNHEAGVLVRKMSQLSHDWRKGLALCLL